MTLYKYYDYLVSIEHRTLF